jgi:hypothetical protein
MNVVKVVDERGQIGSSAAEPTVNILKPSNYAYLSIDLSLPA